MADQRVGGNVEASHGRDGTRVPARTVAAAGIELVGMTRKVAAAEAKARLSELVSRVAHGGERIVIERHGKPVAALVSMADLGKIDTQAEPSAQADPWLRLIESGGFGVDDEVIDRMVELIYAERARNTAPPIDFSDEIDEA